MRLDDLEEEARTAQSPLAAKRKQLEKELSKLKKQSPAATKAMAMAAKDNEGKRFGDLAVRIRGESANLGQSVPRGFLQVASYRGEPKASMPENQSGRVQLAEWLVHPNHPLTARVMANRVWQHLLGQGIVATSDNFGTLGAMPSHPELLDHLADRLIEDGWSVKSLIRKIIRSRTYQQAALTASANDPDNVLLRHQNRRPAPAETIRDSILAIAGQLELKPRQSAVTQLGRFAIETSGKRHASLGQTDQLRHRSIYLPMARGAIPPSLKVFDMPNPDLVTGNRAVTNVPAQALFMLNSPFVREMSQSLGARLTRDNLSGEEVVQELHERIFIREADGEDLAMGKAYLHRLRKEDGRSMQDAIASYAQVLFSSSEFRFIE